MGEARGALRDAISVVVTGLRLVGAHGPVLLVIYLVGSAVRNGVLWAAVEVSAVQPTVAGFMLPLAPLATLTAIVLMLRVVASSLTWATFGPDQDGPRRGAHLALLASTLVPFLTVYAAQGYLKEDVRLFVNAATYDEIFGSAASFYGGAADLDRTMIATGPLLVALVVVALGLRTLIGRLDLPARHVSWGLLAAYVEVLWLFVLARQVTLYQDRGWEWVTGRRVVDWVAERWAGLTDALGPLGEPVRALAQAVGTLLTDADTVLLIPIAWLTVGAVALGRTLDAPPRRQPSRSRLHAGLERVPGVVRRVGAEATADVRDRFRGLGEGLRLLAVGGLLPMLLFCVVFVVARQAGHLVTELWRAVVGPLSRDDALAFTPYFEVLSGAAYTVLLVGLLAAAVDRVVRHRDEAELPPDASTPAQPGASAASTGRSA